jgi:hypothetical protein
MRYSSVGFTFDLPRVSVMNKKMKKRRKIHEERAGEKL